MNADHVVNFLLSSLVGGVFTWTGLAALVPNLRLRRRTARARGRVVGVAASGEPGGLAESIIEFTDDAGVKRQVRAPQDPYAEDTWHWVEGRRALVYYDAANPGAARVSSFSSFWVEPGVLTGIGILILLYGLVVLIVRPAKEGVAWPTF